MSTRSTPKLEAALRERGGHAYIVTVSARGGPHAIYVPVRWEGGEFVAEAVGAKTAANAAARPQVSLLYPVRSADDHSLIVDGTATVEDGGAEHRVRIMPTRMVLHRAAPAPDPDPASACGADCVPLSTGGSG